MFVKPHNYKSVEFMYRDLPNLKYIKSFDDQEVITYLNKNSIESKDLIKIGFESRQGVGFDEMFYLQHLVPFEKRWTDFKVERDFEREKSLYDTLNPKNEKYILIHKSGSDNADRIDYNILDNNLKWIYVQNLTENIFDYLTLVEKANQVHCIESSFHLLVDSINLNENLFFHTIKNNRGFHHKIKLNWSIV
jgi:hypothetical protein